MLDFILERAAVPLERVAPVMLGDELGLGAGPQILCRTVD
jgi:hypothetical protein